MATDLSDGDLVVLIGTGNDAAAEAEFVRRMGPRVRLYGLRHLRAPDAADDLTQHVLLTALQALRENRLRDPAKLASFVLGTCRMTTMDIRRNAQRKDRLDEQFASTFRPSEEPKEPVLDREQLRRCVQGLKERERTVIVMTFYDEQTANDVAGFLGVSDANVRVIRHRAIRQLRQCMGADL